EYAEWHPDDVEGKVHAVHTMTTRPIEGLRDENDLANWDLRSDIAAYRKPLLLLMAGTDRSIVPENISNDVKAHHEPNVRIETFTNQAHNLHRTDFDRFANVMDEFLETLRRSNVGDKYYLQ
ncbi:MAG: alpha/beta hydrolase, partial [Candidatus Eremiobacteraeota bacterium]|nr:alpha/beta hydrolase [Candidatus Eremiobacteraeota bacterium]